MPKNNKTKRRGKADEEKGYSSTAIVAHKTRSIIIMRHRRRERASTVTITWLVLELSTRTRRTRRKKEKKRRERKVDDLSCIHIERVRWTSELLNSRTDQTIRKCVMIEKVIFARHTEVGNREIKKSPPSTRWGDLREALVNCFLHNRLITSFLSVLSTARINKSNLKR